MDIRVSRGNFTLDVATDFSTGVTAIFGRSGSGKTTLVHAIAGLIRDAKGKISLEGCILNDSASGVFIPPHQRHLGCVFQSGNLFPHLDVLANLDYGVRAKGRKVNIQNRSEVIEHLGIAHLLKRRVRGLSGGEAQRVAIGRALLSEPRALLLDEPLAALDNDRKQEIFPYLERLRDVFSLPILFVSHDISEVARLADHVIVLDQGRISRTGAVREIFADPKAVRDVGVRAAGSLIDGVVFAHHDDGLSEIIFSGGHLILPQIDAPLRTAIRVRIEAHDVILATERPRGVSALNILDGIIKTITAGDGPGVIVELDMNGEKLLARITKRSCEHLNLRVGTRCFAVVKTVSVARNSIGLRD